MNDNEQERYEQGYHEGGRTARRAMLNTCLKELGYYEDENLSYERLVSEREETISILRSLCTDFGDNEWDEKQHLADIVDKHLGRHLYGSEKEDDK